MRESLFLSLFLWQLQFVKAPLFMSLWELSYVLAMYLDSLFLQVIRVYVCPAV